MGRFGEPEQSWVLTVPKSMDWAEYQRELAAVADGAMRINYRVRYFPKGMRVGDRCYIVHDGRVRGWMEIVGLADYQTGWTCTTTGREWPAGRYIQRSGPFHPTDGPAMVGFRGVRRFGP